MDGKSLPIICLKSEFLYFCYTKDGKIKIDLPIVSFPYEATNAGGRSRTVYLCGKTGMKSVSIFSEDGKLREKDAKETIEKDLNKIVKEISTSITTNTNDNW